MRHCRYCGNTGHNRRTCPSRSPEVKKADNEYHKLYRRRSRTCRYCRGTNHDKRSCVKLIGDRAEWVKRNAAFRKRFLEDARKEGFGVGCILKIKYWGSEDAHYYFVTKINWDAIVADNRYNYAVTVEQIGAGGAINTLNAPHYFGLETEDERDYYLKNNDTQIETPVPVDTIERMIPSNWLSGEVNKNNLPGNLR